MDDWITNISFKGYLPSSRWASRCEPICNAPVLQQATDCVSADHPAATFARYWRQLKGDKDLPYRSQLRPADIKPMLKWMFMFDRQPCQDSWRYRVRLQGTAVCDLCHGNYEGAYLDSFTSLECYTSRADMFDAAFTTKHPRYAQVRPSMTWSEEDGAEYRLDVALGAFPFTMPDGGDQQIVVVVAPADGNLRASL